jgi:hypothetical protein
MQPEHDNEPNTPDGRATRTIRINFPPPPKYTRKPKRLRVVYELAFAHKIRGRVEKGQVKGYRQAARALGMSKSRLSQLVALMYLAPAIQEAILGLELAPPRCGARGQASASTTCPPQLDHCRGASA